MNITAEILRLRRTDRSLSLQDIALRLDTDRDYVSQVIAKKRKKGIDVPTGTSTSRGNAWKHTPKKGA